MITKMLTLRQDQAVLRKLQKVGYSQGTSFNKATNYCDRYMDRNLLLWKPITGKLLTVIYFVDDVTV